jgi:polysaccharide export outer membrane protein
MKSYLPIAATHGLVLALVCASATLAAQSPAGTVSTPPQVTTPPPNPSAPGSATPDPSLTVRSEKAIADSEPAANEEYTLGAGDEINLDFPGRTELTGKHTIGPDGRITLPLAGGVPLAGLTRDQAGAAIVKSLSNFYTDISVTVAVDKYTSNRVRVLGYVQHPGEIPFEGMPTLLDAISRAGLISPTVSQNGVTVAVGSGIPEICTIYRNGVSKDGIATNESYQVQLRKLLMSVNDLADLRLRRNDIVFVPEPHEQFVSVLGEVARPGTIPLTPASTLISVLAEAGCCTEGGGFKPKVHIIQPSTGKEFDIAYKDLMSVGSQKEYVLHANDVILIPKTGFFKATYVFQRLSPVTSLAGLATVALF